jgi:hypothetical protein
MMMAYYSNVMAMTLDLMAYLKNNDGNALRYYLRSAMDGRSAKHILQKPDNTQGRRKGSSAPPTF